MAYTNRWLTIRDAAERACCTPAKIHRAVRSGQLQAARKTGSGALVFLESWIDEWLIAQLLPEDPEVTVCVDAAPCASREFSGLL
jgi:predicted DNA-binding transcriptional regulator AlpA